MILELLDYVAPEEPAPERITVWINGETVIRDGKPVRPNYDWSIEITRSDS